MIFYVCSDKVIEETKENIELCLYVQIERGKNMADNKNVSQEELNNDEEMTVTLTLDDGSVIECVVLTIFPAGGKEYIALLPMEEAEEEEGEVYLYRYSEDENGEPNLENIEDDDEYEIVADAFDELLDKEEYDELVGEDELED